MNEIISEIATRSWVYTSKRVAELQERDSGQQELEVVDKQLREFIVRFQAGSMFLDLFQATEMRRLVDEVFTHQAIQLFVFDLQWHATVGLSREQMREARKSLAGTLAPGFERTAVDGFNLTAKHELIEAISQVEFEDPKWKLTESYIDASLAFLPWLVPLLLISTGETLGWYADEVSEPTNGSN